MFETEFSNNAQNFETEFNDNAQTFETEYTSKSNVFSGEFNEAGGIFKGDDGKSAYQIALDNGFVGTEAEWLASLKGESGVTAEEVQTMIDASLGVIENGNY